MHINFDTSSTSESEVRGFIALLNALLPNGQAKQTQQLQPAPLVPPPTSHTFHSPLPELVPTPRNEEQAIFGVPVTGNLPGTSEAAQEPAVSPATTEQPAVAGQPKRHRRTKAEMEADAAAATQQAAQTLPPIMAAVAVAAAAGARQPAAQPATSTHEPPSADDLRALLNGYITRHSMEDAIGVLRSFACNRVTEALALPPETLIQLAASLNG